MRREELEAEPIIRELIASSYLIDDKIVLREATRPECGQRLRCVSPASGPRCTAIGIDRWVIGKA
jgi:hypothetical protein